MAKAGTGSIHGPEDVGRKLIVFPIVCTVSSGCLAELLFNEFTEVRRVPEIKAIGNFGDRMIGGT